MRHDLGRSATSIAVTPGYCTQCGHPTGRDEPLCPACGAALPPPNEPPTSKAVHVLDGRGGDLPRAQLDALIADRATHAPSLLVVRGPNVGSRFTLVEDVTEIGRAPTAELFLDDITVSRRHAELRKAGRAYLLVDLDSLNGTYVNGERVERAVLEQGDLLQIGRFKLLFLERGRPQR